MRKSKNNLNIILIKFTYIQRPFILGQSNVQGILIKALICSWSKTLEGYELLIILWNHRCQNQYRSSSLGMTDVMDFILPCSLQNVVNVCWKIQTTYLFPGEHPEFGVSSPVRIQGGVVSGEIVSACVKEPDIVAFLSEDVT